MNGLKQGSLLQGGKYRIESVLGQGGFGITYGAVQVALNRRVAIKEFFMKEYCERNADTSHVTLGTAGSAETVQRFKEKFMKEARMIASFDHHGIVRVLDVFEENGTAYYVMDYHAGGSLADKVKQGRPLPEDQAAEYIRQVASALDYIHERNTVHLDVKPTNILLNAKGESVLIDFGISKHYDGSGSQTSSTPVGISKGYTPLEQGRDGDVSQFKPSTDIYALGATLYYLVTGQVPAEASFINEYGLDRPSGISERMWNVIQKAMQPKRKDRPQSIQEFLALFDAPIPGKEPGDGDETVVPVASEPKFPPSPKPQPKPQPQPPSTKRSFWPYVAAVVGVCIGLGSLYFRGCFGNDRPVQGDTLQENMMSAPIQTITANGVSFKMIRVEGGTFTMGATSEQGSDAFDGEKPAHQVTLSSYHIGETEVTQALWEAVMGSNPSYFKGANRPVEMVSWDDCQTFIRKLNAMTGKTFRLPTEAEWEYAARGGNRSKGYKYSGSNTLDDVGWYYENSGNSRLDENHRDYDKLDSNGCCTHPVKQKKANELGIYDMSGNVYEWCQDWYDDYSSSSQTNPTGPSSGSCRVYHGGCWDSSARGCRVSYRVNGKPGRRLSGLGLRLAL